VRSRRGAPYSDSQYTCCRSRELRRQVAGMGPRVSGACRADALIQPRLGAARLGRSGRSPAHPLQGPHRTGINRLADQWLPKPHILYPWPNHRRRQTSKVGAGCRNAARPVRAKGAQKWASLPQSVAAFRRSPASARPCLTILGRVCAAYLWC
jgi:hypothetical protein